MLVSYADNDRNNIVHQFQVLSSYVRGYLKASVDLTLFSFIEKIFVLNLAILQIGITLAVSSSV